MQRTSPNILITGTPGCGKSTLSAELAGVTGLNFLSVNDIAKENGLYDSYDEENECHVLDEDRVVDELELKMQEGGQRWFDIVFVLRTNNEVLFPRLKARGYKPKKIQDIIHCEIVQVVLDEARESYNPEIVHELPSETTDDLQQNISRITAWIEQWKADHN